MATATRKPRLAIVAPDLEWVLAHGVLMQRLFEPTLVESALTLRDSARVVRAGTDLLITQLSNRESVIDVRELLNDAGATPILFLAERLPLRAPLARVLAAAGHAVLPESAPVVVEATVIALLAERRGSHG